MKPIDMRPVYRKYKGLWVALKGDTNKVIASGGTLQSALNKARRLGFNKPVMEKIPTKFYPSLIELQPI